jgi:hypothetical protein
MCSSNTPDVGRRVALLGVSNPLVQFRELPPPPTAPRVAPDLVRRVQDRTPRRRPRGPHGVPVAVGAVAVGAVGATVVPVGHADAGGAVRVRLGGTGPLSQGVQAGRQALKILHTHGAEVRRKKPRGFERTPWTPYLFLPAVTFSV